MEATSPTMVSHFHLFFWTFARFVIKKTFGWPRVVFVYRLSFSHSRCLPFLSPCVCFPIAAAAALSSSSPHLSYGVLFPSQITLGAAHYCLCGETSDVLWFASGWTCIAGRGGWVWETTCEAGETRNQSQESPEQRSSVWWGGSNVTDEAWRGAVWSCLLQCCEFTAFLRNFLLQLGGWVLCSRALWEIHLCHLLWPNYWDSSQKGSTVDKK